MKLKTPRGIWALRGVTATIAIIVLLVLGTIGYSAYEEYNLIRSELAGGAHPAVGRAVNLGPSQVVSINVTITNGGLYMFNVSVGCTYPSSNVVCALSSVAVPPGQTGVLHFHMTVVNLAQFSGSGDRTINGTIRVAMQPFVTLSINTDFGGFVNTGGA